MHSFTFQNASLYILQYIAYQFSTTNTIPSPFRVKTKTSAKYGLEAQPRLVDIIAAVPPQYRRALVPKLKAKPIRTASGVCNSLNIVPHAV